LQRPSRGVGWRRFSALDFAAMEWIGSTIAFGEVVRKP
jgi:hypothetical protein